VAAVQEVAAQEVAVQEVEAQEIAVQEVAAQEVAVQELAAREVAVLQYHLVPSGSLSPPTQTCMEPCLRHAGPIAAIYQGGGGSGRGRTKDGGRREPNL
jgi:hypothetical protein